jgi:hypothetical protein
MEYCIIETESGWIVVERGEGVTAEQAAVLHGGTVIDPGPYSDYQEACEAMEALSLELDEEDDSSDISANQALEGRSEGNE